MIGNRSSDGLEIILASASSSRANLLRNACIPFETRAPNIDEEPIKASLKQTGAAAIEAAEALAELKAITVSKTMPHALVIGADQILDLEGQWFDKPVDIKQAREHLLSLRGRTHYLATAVVIAFGGVRVWHAHDCPELTMRSFSDAFIDQYLATAGDAILSSVGAYHLEGLGAQLFDKIDGSFFSILGLPLLPVMDFLRGRGTMLS
jgi:septum formation protein|tara:strand:+ start:910 stop:1530 length:621 start_codon:yes stop_codon:yes gene_type:complete